MLTIDFEMGDEPLVLRDTLIVDASTPDAEIEALKQARYADWFAGVTAVHVPDDTPADEVIE